MDLTLVVQSDGSIVADSLHPEYEQIREHLLKFADLTSQVARLHVYQMTRLSLWQAAALGLTARFVLEILRSHSNHGIPYNVQEQIVQDMGRFGRIQLVAHDETHFALIADPSDVQAIRTACKLPKHKRVKAGGGALVFANSLRAGLKQMLSQHGFPCTDQVAYQTARKVHLSWNHDIQLRPYQDEALSCFLNNKAANQSGVIVLPCGAGKTLVGIGAITEVGVETLILTPTDTAGNQWRQELLHKTTVDETAVGLYRETNQVSPITIATYPRVASSNQRGRRRHLETLSAHPWGLVIYDEVHMLPAPLFRLAADMQSARRLGLTATLIREDGAQTDVFSLIGPKLYEAQWKDLERQGYLAPVRCVEVRCDLSTTDRADYESVNRRGRHKVAALARVKLLVLADLARVHAKHPTLIIGHYLHHLYEAADLLECPIITGKTPYAERERWFEDFRSGKIGRLVLSRVANMSVDIPCATVIIQLSGLYGSRQEEAQRLGRLLRPDSGPGVFYTLVSSQTVEAEMSRHRSLFLIEQGYRYEVIDAPSADFDNPTERVIHS